jgi:hypothetical protein
MEKTGHRIYWKIAFMKKVFGFAASFVLIMVSANAQSGKKEPPPPPPKVIMDEKVKVKKIDGELVTEPPVITIRGEKADKFYKRNPSVAGISRQENLITIKKKDGTTEKYDMSKKEDDKSFTEKYGVSPIPPPPPPPKPKSKA